MSLLDNLITSGDVTGLAALVTALDAQVTTLDSALADLQVEAARARAYDVRRFIPVGEVLSTINFEAAFDAAHAAAEAASIGLNGECVFVPRGEWPITSPKLYTNLPGYKRNIGIIGEGRDATIFDVTAPLGDYVFSWEPPSKTAAPTDIGYGLWLEGFSVRGHGNAGGGIRIVHNVRARMRDVEVRDFGGATDYEMGFGLFVGKDRRYTTSQIQDQDMVAYNCSFEGNQGGICITRLVGSSPWTGITAQGNVWIDAAFDGAQVSIMGIEYQSGGGGTASTKWASGLTTQALSLVSGWNTEVLTGTGASVSVASGEYTTISNLGGVITDDHLYHWFEIDAGDGLGLYFIAEIVDSNTLKVLKGSTHASASGLAWRILGTRGGNKVTLLGSNYSEGYKRCGVLCLKDQVTASFYDLHLRDTNNATYGVEAHGVAGGVIVRGGTTLATTLWATQCGDVQAPETPLSKIIVDEFTRPGLVCRGFETKPDGTALVPAHAGVQLFNVVRSKRLRSACAELGAVERWSSRLTPTLNLSGADVTQWDGAIHGTALTPQNAGVYPQYSASDSDFGGVPGVHLVGNASAALVAGLSGTILSTHFPNSTFSPTLFAVFHLPSGATKTDDRRIQLNANGGADYILAFLYSSNFAADYGAQYSGNDGSSQVATSPSALADSSARVLAASNSARSGFWLSMDDGATKGTLQGFRDFWTNVGDVDVVLPNYVGYASGGLHLAELIVFPHPFTTSQFRDLADIAANEIPNVTSRI